MSTDRNPLSDKELWQRFATPSVAPGTAARTVSDLEFAAWLEGRLSEAEASRIEAAVAADPVLRRSALELSEVLGMPFPAPSPRLAARAQGLIGYEADREVSRNAPVGGWLSRLLSATAGFGMPRAAMASLALVVAIAGFMLGGGLGESYAEQSYMMAGNQATQSPGQTNEVAAFFSTDGI